MNKQEQYEGVALKIRGREYVIPALSFGQLENLAPELERSTQAAGQTMTKEVIQDTIKIFHAAISRNYPEITIDEVKNMIDMRNMKTIMAAIMGASGFVLGEGAGEQTPVV
ncbi:MAG: putative phage associated protein [Firmicutes bacterium]|nr:putative phage associated protein [Bacillota bacterium]